MTDPTVVDSPWRPMELVQPDLRNVGEIRKAIEAMGFRPTDDELRPDEMWRNDRYTVTVRRMPPGDPEMPTMVHLSIRRNDREAVHDWRHLQRIKNDIVGPECEGVEVYPAESRLADTANQYHLWVFDDPEFRLGVGFRDRMVGEASLAGRTKQRPWHPADRPADCDAKRSE